MQRILVIGCLVSICGLVTSCQTAYYATMEKFGVHKREILVDRVKEARDSQDDAKEQFKDALTQFTEVLNFKGGKLEAKYNKLNKAFEQSEARANEVRARIDQVESVSKALFKEWKAELDQYTSAELRRSSEQQYRTTQSKYTEMMDSMQAAAKKMNPVLAAFRDQVLFLKHNLNSQAIASIQHEASNVEKQVAALIREMEASIAEADSFVRDMGVLK